ncbi:hypothetical protein QT974_31145 [Microcoleus sp. herbarium12]
MAGTWKGKKGVKTMVSSKEYPVGSKENPERGYVEKAMEALYDDKTYIAVGKKLYRFTGTYHEWQNISVEQRRIAEWLSTYAEEVRPGKFVYKYATSACVRQVWRMVLIAYAETPDKLILKPS